MNYLELNQTGTIHGKLVRCEKGICKDCAFILDPVKCESIPCFEFDRHDKNDVIYKIVKDETN